MPATEVFQRVGSTGSGLTWPAAEERLARFGRNELASQQPPSGLAVFWAATRHPFNAVLGVLARSHWRRATSRQPSS